MPAPLGGGLLAALTSLAAFTSPDLAQAAPCPQTSANICLAWTGRLDTTADPDADPPPPAPDPAVKRPPAGADPLVPLPAVSALPELPNALGAVAAVADAGLTEAERQLALARGQLVITAALDRLGTPFSWGGGSAVGPTLGIGRGAQTVGFDCSGFTLYAWAKAGVTLGHYTGTQFRQGDRVRKADLLPGDLVFFGKRKGDPTHVGLFLTDGVMVHAPQSGDVVKKTSFAESPHYSRRYRGAVRPA
ncbi:NlpC/P60 family protein [Streptosporangium soli]|nr:NlpC/P60 family protein [Streptosporangium sp. KLBMP 9127]